MPASERPEYCPKKKEKKEMGDKGDGARMARTKTKKASFSFSLWDLG